MISSFLSKLLMTRQAIFLEEEIKILDLNYFMQPILGMVKLQNELERKDIMRRFGYLASESVVEHFKRRFAIPEEKIMDSWTKLFGLSGFGKLDIISSEKDKTILKVSENSFAKAYVQEYGLQKEPVCHFLCGVFENLMESVSGKPAICKEMGCIGKGNGVCTFEVKIKGK